MTRTGTRNLITDIAGLKVGHAEDVRARTGVTVLTAEAPFTAVIDVRGSSAGTRDTDTLRLISHGLPIEAIVLSGGSIYGLDAPAGAIAHLMEQGRGVPYVAGIPPLPLVPGAILFDLSNGGDKNWGDEPPYRMLGRQATANAAEDFALGNAGAGLGAVAGTYKGGLGSTSAVTEDGLTVGALAAVNAVGSPIIPGTDAFWAFPLEQQAEFGGRMPQNFSGIDLGIPDDTKASPTIAANTTIAIVATDVALSRVALQQMAIMAADGFARALRPVHTPFDGDLVFAVSTGAKAPKLSEPNETLRLGMLAADCLSRAIARGVYEAQTLGAMRSYREIFGQKPVSN
jgi:L-aminopeptidase/D-esterase-like protein